MHEQHETALRQPGRDCEACIQTLLSYDPTKTGYPLPDGYDRYSIEYGDSTCSDINLTSGIKLKLPENPVDHAVVIITNNHQYTTQNAWSVAFVEWDTSGGAVAGTRRLVEYGLPAVTAATGQNRVYTVAHATQRTYTKIKYIAAQDIWMWCNHQST